MGRTRSTTTDFIAVSTSAGFISGNDAFTICMWIKIPDNAGGSNFFNLWNEEGDSPNSVGYNINKAGKIKFSIRGPDSIGIDLFTVDGQDTDVWHHIAGVKRASDDFELYLDFVSVDTNTTDMGLVSIPTQCQYGFEVNLSGQNFGPTGGFASALTLPQIKHFAYTFKCDVQPEWKYIMGVTADGGAGSAEIDFSGNGRNDVHSGTPGIVEGPPVAPFFGYDNVLPFLSAAVAGEEFLGRHYPQGVKRGVMRGVA